MYNFKDYLLNEELTNANLAKMYVEINRIAFDNELPYIQPKVSKRLKRSTGITVATIRGKELVSPIEVKISDKYILDDQTITMILAHEMIHVYFMHIGDFDESHGYKFKAKAAEVGRKLGIEIPLTHDTANLKLNREPEKAAMILITFSNNKSLGSFLNYKSYLKNSRTVIALIKVLASTKVFRDTVERVELYVGSSSFAEKFPKQRVPGTLRKVPNFYNLKDEEVKDIIKNSKNIESVEASL